MQEKIGRSRVIGRSGDREVKILSPRRKETYVDKSALVCPNPKAYNGRGDSMPQSPHERIAEFHNLAAHAHTAAAAAHGKGEHLTAHELSKQAHEHSMNAHKLSEELAAQHARSGK
jgi:hypothetical protein